MIRLALPGAKSRGSFLDANSHGLSLEEEEKRRKKLTRVDNVHEQFNL